MSSHREPVRFWRRAGLLVFAGALGLRVAWVVLQWMRTGPALAYPDEELHWQLAWNLVHDGVMISDDGRYVARMPLYPLFLAPFALIGEHGVLLARLAQCALGAAAACLGMRLTTAALGRRAGLAAGALLAVDPFTIFFCNLLLTEVPFVLIAVGLLASTWRLVCPAEPPLDARGPADGRQAMDAHQSMDAREPAGARGLANRRGSVDERPPGGTRRGLLRALRPGQTLNRATLALAALGAAAVMTRPSAFGWVVLTWLAVWLLDASRARATARVGICAAALALALLPWGLRNRAVTGHYAWLSANGGVTLYDAQGPQARGDSDQTFLREVPELAGLGEVERDRALYRLALEQMRRDPGRVLELAWIKFRRTWSPTPNVEEYRRGAAALVGAAFTVAVLVLAAVGLVRQARRRWRLMVVLWLPVVYFTLLHCVFVGSVRYRIPLMPMVEITAAGALAERRAVRRAAQPTDARRSVRTGA